MDSHKFSELRAELEARPNHTELAAKVRSEHEAEEQAYGIERPKTEAGR